MKYGHYPMGEQGISRSGGTFVPTDQDLHCLFLNSLLFLINIYPVSAQFRTRSDGTDVPADLDLHWSLMI
jgi:hypothetical protein